MPENGEEIRKQERKRRVLVVEDVEINRGILESYLEDSYEMIPAENGREALNALEEHCETLSLVLLDLRLPDMDGIDILRSMKADPRYARIPVIVMTSDRESEVESLNLGASDFISKPYPSEKVIQARVHRTIETSENREAARWAERDPLTGLYSREYFFQYARQYDENHPDQAMDAMVLDVNHFHMINERYGKAYSDEILKQAGAGLQTVAENAGGMACRREADTFLLYCPHRGDYSEMLETISGRINQERKTHVRVRMGVYSSVDRSIDIERRFDRAKMAADTVRSSFTKAVAIYDNTLHETEIFAERLLEDFPRAIEQKQFLVYYQPKFDIRPAEPVLSSAEALVRWFHPELGLISPGVFIPLFESNGLIRELDRYVWREVASQLRAWKDGLGFAVPVSVNVSRVDMLDPDLVEHMNALVADFGLKHSELLLEITESAYTQDAEGIIKTVNRLRKDGFMIEMDDFGSGYSSLNMISTLPIDALKLDMQFIRTAFSERKNTRMLEVVFDIADSLHVPTIAEGVETAEQMYTLKSMGCDIVQGYFFSRPVPPNEFEPFLITRREICEAEGLPEDRIARSGSGREEHERFHFDTLHDPVTGLYNQRGFTMLYRDADRDHSALLVAEIRNYGDLPLRDADRLAEKTANIMRQYFRSVDLICRLREDRFVVIVNRVNSTMTELICDKVKRINLDLEKEGAEILAGAAFGDRIPRGGDLLESAGSALTKLKQSNGNGCLVF